MRIIGKCIMSKKAELIKKFENKGFTNVEIKWIPKNPYGKKPKLNGWIYRISGENWEKLANNYEEAVKEIDLI